MVPVIQRDMSEDLRVASAMGGPRS